MKDDTISRQAEIDEVKKHYRAHDNDLLELITFDIERLPSAQRWIPVSERLPEVGQNVLLSVGKGLYTAEGNLKDDGTWVQYRWSANLNNVDAWADMPESWKGDEKDV